jgi:hypothetical protein
LKITVLFFKFTSLHFKPQISPCRTPVNKASNTTSWRFWSLLQTSRNRCCSSTVRYRVHWLFSGSHLNSQHGFTSIQPQSSNTHCKTEDRDDT